MKLKLVLKVEDNKGRDSEIKFNIAPSKQIGLLKFLEFALKNESEVSVSFEKISTSGSREESKVIGEFIFEGKVKELEEPLEMALEDRRKKKKKRKK